MLFHGEYLLITLFIIYILSYNLINLNIIEYYLLILKISRYSKNETETENKVEKNGDSFDISLTDNEEETILNKCRRRKKRLGTKVRVM